MEETGRGSPSCGLGVCVATGVAWMPVDTSTPSQTQQLSQSHQWALCWDCTGKHSHSFWLPDPGTNPGLPHCRQTLYHLNYQGSR